MPPQCRRGVSPSCNSRASATSARAGGSRSSAAASSSDLSPPSRFFRPRTQAASCATFGVGRAAAPCERHEARGLIVACGLIVVQGSHRVCRRARPSVGEYGPGLERLLCSGVRRGCPRVQRCGSHVGGRVDSIFGDQLLDARRMWYIEPKGAAVLATHHLPQARRHTARADRLRLVFDEDRVGGRAPPVQSGVGAWWAHRDRCSVAPRRCGRVELRCGSCCQP